MDRLGGADQCRRKLLKGRERSRHRSPAIANKRVRPYRHRRCCGGGFDRLHTRRGTSARHAAHHCRLCPSPIKSASNQLGEKGARLNAVRF